MSKGRTVLGADDVCRGFTQPATGHALFLFPFISLSFSPSFSFYFPLFSPLSFLHFSICLSVHKGGKWSFWNNSRWTHVKPLFDSISASCSLNWNKIHIWINIDLCVGKCSLLFLCQLNVAELLKKHVLWKLLVIKINPFVCSLCTSAISIHVPRVWLISHLCCLTPACWRMWPLHFWKFGASWIPPQLPSIPQSNRSMVLP